MIDRLWHNKINRARWIEKQILLYYISQGKKASFPTEHQKGYDIECPELGNIEIKEDLVANHSNNYAIEFEDALGQPSGIDVVTANVFVIVDQKAVVTFQTESFKQLIKETMGKKVINMGYKTLVGKQARGWLISRDTILSSPYADTKERWF